MSWPETAARCLLQLPPSAGTFADFPVFSNPGQIRSKQIELLHGFREQFAPDGFRRTIRMLESCSTLPETPLVPAMTRHLILGIIAWVGGCAAVWLALLNTGENEQASIRQVAGEISQWIAGARSEQVALSETLILLAPGDPVLMRRVDGGYLQVGNVRNHFSSALKEAYTRQATVVLHDDVDVHAPHGFVLHYYSSPTSLEWVVRTMVPPERQQEIAKLIADDWKSHREEVLMQLQPVMEKSLVHAVDAIEAELPAIIQGHRSEFGQLADRYQSEIIRRQIVPLVRKEILPIVEDEITPIANELGQELWDRVSLWSFTWRYLYDVSPLPEKNAVKTEFDRFLDQEVKPQLESRSDQFVAVTQRIISRVSRHEKVRAVIRENLRKVSSDPELQAIIWSVVQESILQNEKLKSSLRDYWKSDEVQDALLVANVRFEPTARAIGDAIFGSREKGVTSEFSRVLRSQILQKDRRWLIVVPLDEKHPKPQISDSDHPIHSLQITVAKDTMDFPLNFEGTAQSPLTRIDEAVETSEPEPSPQVKLPLVKP